MNLRKERGEKTKQEILLELDHIGIEAALAVAMAVNLQVCTNLVFSSQRNLRFILQKVSATIKIIH
jgi:hypothetical protein